MDQPTEVGAITNRELAEKLNISPAALSMILNHRPGISDARREQVIAELNKMGYGDRIKAKRHGKAPSTVGAKVNGGGHICLALYKRSGKFLEQRPFFLLLLENIVQRAREYGRTVTLATIEYDNPDIVEQLSDMHSDGILVFSTEMLAEDLEPFYVLGIPFVAMDQYFDLLPVNSVSIDNQMGTYLAIRHLVAMGHSEIGYLKSETAISGFQERDAGYRSAMRSFGLELRSEHVISLPFSEDKSFQVFQKLLQSGYSPPSAYVSDDDILAVGVLRALLSAGFRVPEDVSLVGFNNRPACELTIPQLSTISVSRPSFGSESVDLLERLIRRAPESDMQPVKIRLATRLMERGSVLDRRKPK